MSCVVVELISIFLNWSKNQSAEHEMKHPVNKSEGSLAIFAILRRQTKPLLMENRTNRDLTSSALVSVG